MSESRVRERLGDAFVSLRIQMEDHRLSGTFNPGWAIGWHATWRPTGSAVHKQARAATMNDLWRAILTK